MSTETLTTKHQIPETFPFRVRRFDDTSFNMDEVMNNYKLRDEWMDKGMFAFVCKEWTTPLAKWIGNRTCLEVMAGAGWLAKALREDGVSIVATDDMSWHNQPHIQPHWELVTEVIKIDARKAVIKYGKTVDFLIISWAYMDDVAFQTIQALHVVNPKAQIIMIGEGWGGCTFSDKYFEHFEELINPEFDKIAGLYKSWQGIYDYIRLGKYKP